MFEIILDYLRSGYLKDLTESSLKELEIEAEYFMLSNLQKIINQRYDVNVIVEGETFKCKGHALQYCDKELIDYKGDFICDYYYISDLICDCPRERNGCDCILYHETPMEYRVRRILRRLEDNRVGDVEPPWYTELRKDSLAAIDMGLLPGYPNPKWFY